MTAPRIRVHLADGDPFLRLGLEAILKASPDLELETITGTGEEAVEAALRERPDVVLMETAIDIVCSMDAVRRIRSGAPRIKVIMLSAAHDIETMSRAYSAGASSFLAKNSVSTDLCAAIRLIATGNEIFSKPLNADSFPDRPSKKHELQSRFIREVSPRDKRILIALAKGQTNTQIASLIHVSEGTVKAQIAKLMEPLHVHTRVQLAVLVVQAGLLVENKVSVPLSVGPRRPSTRRA